MLVELYLGNEAMALFQTHRQKSAYLSVTVYRKSLELQEQGQWPHTWTERSLMETDQRNCLTQASLGK